MVVKSNKPYITGNEIKYIKDILDNGLEIAGDGDYTKKVHNFLEKRYKVPKVLLTTSGSTALEFAVRLSNLKPGDEVIVPSFTFSSTANAVLIINGLKVVFADVKKDTLNIDPEDIKRKLTNKTKAIIVVHYAGVACEMDEIMNIAKRKNIIVIEDAAQAIEAKYKGKYIGTIGDFGCISFHGTKNISSGEGGALFINSKNSDVHEKAEIIREKGTDRSRFLRNLVDKYTWRDIGSSYLPSDMLAAFLLAQLEKVEKITQKRLKIFNNYYKNFLPYQTIGLVNLPSIPNYAESNGHIFFLVFNNEKNRNYALNQLRAKNIGATFHYIPLHSSPFGKKLSNSRNNCPVTEQVSGSLLRLPLYPDLSRKEQEYVIKHTKVILDELIIKENIDLKINYHPKRTSQNELLIQAI